MATITFLGAAQEVTGSCHLLESPAIGRVLLDCGMHQGGDAVERIQDETFAFDPVSIDAVLLSHAHLDHCGMLPKLYHEGFRGDIVCTRATAELLDVMLHDSVGLYLRDLERTNIRNARRGRPEIEAVFDMDDVEGVLGLCRGHAFGERVDLGPAGVVVFHDAGHILGSSIVEVIVNEQSQQKTLVFSGDLGKRDSVLMNEPTLLKKADVVLMESTYGDREHRDEESSLHQLRDILSETWRRGGSVMIPAFAVGRTQDVLFHLGCLHQQGELDNWQVFLDSPMAIAVTRVYDRWLELLDSDEVRQLSEAHRSSLETFLPTLNLAISTEESMAINRIKGGAIIIAGSGMCTGGRIRHHFKQRIWDDRNTIVFTGYQAQGTLGRILVDGAKRVKLFDEDYVIKCQIETLSGLSAHAGQGGLLSWMASFQPQPRAVLVHGEPRAQDVLREKLWEEQGLAVEVPARGQSIVY
ncbi:MBL fold metallo-hydrolase RNA specificity domain-containing protein [Pseudohalioglobus lutimaris]|uniref:MBL fold metallo-hydrolase n=1 Tax=Pseudohalioglobus lutimaris TaxID=1737061 RepID=A0A2N5X6R2_9GAMM|nr:MBL fold metallo-hydrolase [Pseudohalioglobus lutimaris]PLW70174.1 MBL fold metallo-hydrolase [Pseudohalioglobus lutimaris]